MTAMGAGQTQMENAGRIWNGWFGVPAASNAAKDRPPQVAADITTRLVTGNKL